MANGVGFVGREGNDFVHGIGRQDAVLPLPLKVIPGGGRDIFPDLGSGRVRGGRALDDGGCAVERGAFLWADSGLRFSDGVH